MSTSQNESTNPRLDILWGAEQIGRAINLSQRQVFYLVESGQLPCVRKVGAKWCADRGALVEFFTGKADSAKA